MFPIFKCIIPLLKLPLSKVNFLKYSSMNALKHLALCNYYHNQDLKWFPHPERLCLLCIHFLSHVRFFITIILSFQCHCIHWITYYVTFCDSDFHNYFLNKISLSLLFETSKYLHLDNVLYILWDPWSIFLSFFFLLWVLNFNEFILELTVRLLLEYIFKSLGSFRYCFYLVLFYGFCSLVDFLILFRYYFPNFWKLSICLLLDFSDLLKHDYFAF